MSELELIKTFIQKRKLVKERPKSISLLKLASNEKAFNPKLEYLDLLNQIKKKKKYIGNSALFNKLMLNTSQKGNYLRYKLFNQNIGTSLITETSNKKKISHKNISTNATLTNSFKINKLLFYHNNKNIPKKFINEIIKFDNNNMNIRKIILSKKREPMGLSNSYKEYLEKSNKLNFYEYSNLNTEYAHTLRTKYLIKKNDEVLIKEIHKNKIYLKKEKERKENEKELRDKVPNPSLDLMKISKQLKYILANEYRFNQIEKKEKFFNNFENRINFLFDNYKPPNIKNNLIKIKYNDINYATNTFEWKWMNGLGINAINYLSNVKIKLQREKDEKMKFLMEKDKITKRYMYYKKLSTNKIYNSKDEIEKIIYKKYYIKNDEDKISEKEKKNFDEFFEYKNYFLNKLEKYEKISIATPRLRRFVFDSLNINLNINKKEYINNL